jgi:hypothetical protein
MKMAVLQAKKLKAALEKAKKVGLIEQPVTIAGCSLVFRSLTPEEYEAIGDETRELEDVAYLHGFQIGHLCRAIVEIDGVDLRDATLIEVEEEDGKTVKLEKHAWVRDTLLNTWGREAINVGWRKFAELLIKAEEKAKEGIQFDIAEETDEEKLRRLLGEIRELGDSIPGELLIKTLGESGLAPKVSQAEVDAAAAKLAEVAAEAQPVPQPPQQQDSSVDALMRNRTPMNQGAVDVPPPPQSSAPVQVSASQKVPVPEAIRQAATPVQNLSRAAQIASLEGEPPPVQFVPQRPSVEAVELKRPVPGGGQVPVDRPPVAGVNPRYSPPRRA